MKTKLLALVIFVSSMANMFADEVFIKAEATALVDGKSISTTPIVFKQIVTGSLNFEPQLGERGFSVLPRATFKDGKMLYTLTCVAGPQGKEDLRIDFSGETEKGNPITIKTRVNGKSYVVTVTLKPVTLSGKVKEI